MPPILDIVEEMSLNVQSALNIMIKILKKSINNNFIPLRNASTAKISLKKMKFQIIKTNVRWSLFFVNIVNSMFLVRTSINIQKYVNQEHLYVKNATLLLLIKIIQFMLQLVQEKKALLSRIIGHKENKFLFIKCKIVFLDFQEKYKDKNHLLKKIKWN